MSVFSSSVVLLILVRNFLEISSFRGTLSPRSTCLTHPCLNVPCPAAVSCDVGFVLVPQPCTIRSCPVLPVRATRQLHVGGTRRNLVLPPALVESFFRGAITAIKDEVYMMPDLKPKQVQLHTMHSRAAKCCIVHRGTSRDALTYCEVFVT